MLKILLAAMISLSIITACGRNDDQMTTPSPSPATTDNANNKTGSMADDMGNAVNDVEDGVGDAVKGAGDAVKNTGNAIKNMNTGK